LYLAALSLCRDRRERLFDPPLIPTWKRQLNIANLGRYALGWPIKLELERHQSVLNEMAEACKELADEAEREGQS
jgi:hypothetical protein